MKSQKYELVAKAILALIHQSGVGAVTHSRVARLSQVSRPWIYKYVGKSDAELIEFAAIHFGKKILEIGQSGKSSSSNELTSLVLDATWILIERFSDWKEILPLYFRYAGTKNPLGLMVEKLEQEQLKELSRAVAKLFKIPVRDAYLVAELILAMRMGIGFRYSQLGLNKEYKIPEVKKALRRIFQHSAAILKSME